MENILGKYSAGIYAALRIVAGLMFLQHGFQNVFGMFGGARAFGGEPAPFPSAIFFAGVIELVAGVLIAVGLKASWAGFIASGEMAVAYWWKLAPVSLFPIVNRGENAVLYCFVFLYVASRGSGPYSLDALMKKPQEGG